MLLLAAISLREIFDFYVLVTSVWNCGEPLNRGTLGTLETPTPHLAAALSEIVSAKKP